MPRNEPSAAEVATLEATAVTAVANIKRDADGRLIDPATIAAPTVTAADKPALTAKAADLSAKAQALIGEGKHVEASKILAEHEKLTAQIAALDTPAPVPTMASLGPQEMKPGDRAAGVTLTANMGQFSAEQSLFFADPDAAMLQEDHSRAADAKARAMRDKGWVEMYNNGDPDAMAQMVRWNSILNTLIFQGDLAAWKAKFGKYLPKAPAS